MTPPDSATKTPTKNVTPIAAALRIPARLRVVQLGTSLVAAGLLASMLGPAPQEREVETAARSVPMAPSAQVEQRTPPEPVEPRKTPPEPVNQLAAHKSRVATADPIDRWINEATAVLERSGYSGEQLDREAIRTIILHESGGNPGAFNGWDSNAAAGTPSKGLMQTIEPTFESYALPGHTNIWDPVDNIIAATRYSVDRYGSVESVPGVVGVRAGGGYEGY